MSTEFRALRLVQLKAHLKGFILRELDLSVFKFLEGDDTPDNKRAKLLKGLRTELNLGPASIASLCAPAVTRSFVDWLVDGGAYSKKTKVVMAVRGKEQGRGQDNLSYEPELAGIAVYGAFSARKEWDGSETSIASYPGRWTASKDGALQAAIEDNAVGEIELVCGKEGAGSLLLEHCIARLMNLNAKKNAAILVNLAGKTSGRSVIYPLLNTVKRLGFAPVSLDVVHKNSGEVKSAASVERRERTRWYGLTPGSTWREGFAAHMTAQMRKFAPASENASGFLCPVFSKSGFAACT
jgi:hypothetical protein